MVEFALVVPILCVVLFGILQFGALYNDYVTLTDAARVGARKAARRRHDADPAGGRRGGGPELGRRARRGTSSTSTSARPHGSTARSVTVTATYPYEIDLLGFVVASGRPRRPRPRSVWNEPSSQRSRPGRRPQRRLHGRPARRHGDGARRRLLVPRPARDPVGRRRSCARRRAGAAGEHRHLERTRIAVPRVERRRRRRVQLLDARTSPTTRSRSRSRARPTASSPSSSGSTRSTCTRRRARAPATPTAQRYAAPIAVDRAHPLLNCPPRPCLPTTRPTLDLEKTGPGAFRLLNLDQSHGGTGGKIDYGMDRERLRRLHAARLVRLRPGRGVQRQEVQGGDERPHRGRAALSRLRRGSGQRRELRVPRGRLGRLPRHRASTPTGTRQLWTATSSESSGREFSPESGGGSEDFGVRSVELVE